MPQKDHGACELDHPDEALWVVFPANDNATKVMKPGEQAFHFPPMRVAVQNTAVLRRGCDAREFVGCDELHKKRTMSTREKFVKAWLGMLALAEELQNISWACGRDFPLSLLRDQRSLRELGPEGLARQPRRKPRMPNQTPPELEAKILEMAEQYPAYPPNTYDRRRRQISA